MSKHTPGPWLDFGDSSDEASGIIRIKTPNGWVDATPGDIALMLAGPELLTALADAQQALANAIHSATPPSAASAIAWKYAEDKARALIERIEKPSSRRDNDEYRVATVEETREGNRT